MEIVGTNKKSYRGFKPLSKDLGISYTKAKKLCLEGIPFNGVYYDVIEKHVERAGSSICWTCEKTDKNQCTWFDPDNQKMPEGAEYTSRIASEGTRSKYELVTIKKCPDFEPEKGIEANV